MNFERLSVLRTVSVAKTVRRRKRPDALPFGGSKTLAESGVRQVYWRLAKGMLLMSTLAVGLTCVPSVGAQTCVYCAANGGCYPTSRGYYYCWPSGSRCLVSVPCAVAGGGDCDGDPECLPRPVPLFLEKKTDPAAEAARVKAQKNKNAPNRFTNHHVVP